MDSRELGNQLERSLERQNALIKGSLVLNPVENFPFSRDLAPGSSAIHGLYNTDKLRSDEQKIQTDHQFAGRDRLAYDSRRIYAAWARALGAADVSMRLLSGLHAHAVIFMSLSRPGDRVLLLPEEAGGHMSTKSILERLGIEVVEMALDTNERCVDLKKTLAIIKRKPPDFIFVDRSEGLIYEDFTELVAACDVPAIFDASQYLSNIIAGDYPNPFDMGFDYIVSTIHKNFPGPQKAIVATRRLDETWTKMLSGISTFVSNMHSFSTYSAGLTLARSDWISEYSSRMISNTMQLDAALGKLDLPTVRRQGNASPTHHIWLQASSRDEAFGWFKRLERRRIYVNYRKLPYDLGFGLRLGLAGITRLGLQTSEASIVAELIAAAMDDEDAARVRHDVRAFAERLWVREAQA